MKKFIGSIVTICSLFITTNAMELKPIERRNILNRAIIDRNLPSVFAHIDCIKDNHLFFFRLSIADKYWLLLATLNHILDISYSSRQGVACLEILLSNMYTFFGYKTLDEFNRAHGNNTFLNFLELLVIKDIQKVMSYAVNHNFEMIMYLMLNHQKILAQACSLLYFQSLESLSIAIGHGHCTVAKTIIEAFIPYLFKEFDNAEELIAEYMQKPFLSAATWTKLHSQSTEMIDVFLENDSIANNLSLEVLDAAKALVSNNKKAKKLIKNVILLRQTVDHLTPSDSEGFNQ